MQQTQNPSILGLAQGAITACSTEPAFPLVTLDVVDMRHGAKVLCNEPQQISQRYRAVTPRPTHGDHNKVVDLVVFQNDPVQGGDGRPEDPREGGVPHHPSQDVVVGSPMVPNLLGRSFQNKICDHSLLLGEPQHRDIQTLNLASNFC